MKRILFLLVVLIGPGAAGVIFSLFGLTQWVGYMFGIYFFYIAFIMFLFGIILALGKNMTGLLTSWGVAALALWAASTIYGW